MRTRGIGRGDVCDRKPPSSCRVQVGELLPRNMASLGVQQEHHHHTDICAHFFFFFLKVTRSNSVWRRVRAIREDSKF